LIMRIVQVVPKDIHILFELPYSEVRNLIGGLNVTELDLDANKPEDAKILETFQKFHKLLVDLEKELSDPDA